MCLKNQDQAFDAVIKTNLEMPTFHSKVTGFQSWLSF